MCTESYSSDAWEGISELLRSTEPTFEFDLTYCREHPPDPIKHPATSAIIAAYVMRLEMLLSSSRKGSDGLRDLAHNHPHLTDEIQDFQQWIKQRKPGTPARSFSQEEQDLLGDWLVKHIDASYSRARRFVSGVAKSLSPKGAPSKRVQALKMLDARLANGWSYSKLASEMCDCGGRNHGSHCSERIRKRIKELEAFLDKHGINLKSSDPGEK